MKKHTMRARYEAAEKLLTKHTRTAVLTEIQRYTGMQTVPRFSMNGRSVPAVKLPLFWQK